MRHIMHNTAVLLAFILDTYVWLVVFGFIGPEQQAPIYLVWIFSKMISLMNCKIVFCVEIWYSFFHH